SRTLQWREVVEWQPQVLVIACCGFDVPRTMKDLPVLRSYPDWPELPCVREDRVYVLNGSDYFSRPGPLLVGRLVSLAHVLLTHTINPDITPLPLGLPTAGRVSTSRALSD